MRLNEKPSSIFITREHEQPPLEYGPQRLHYMYSVGIPQAYLTLFSILQGLIFSILLTAIPLPQELNRLEIWSLLSRHYLLLPYLISLGIVILIWLHLVSITLTGGWSHSFFQVGLVTLLTAFEVCLARSITIPSLWLFLAGCIGIMGGIILIRTGIMQRPEDFHASLPFQNFGSSLKLSEISRGKYYIFIGFFLIIFGLAYNTLLLVLKRHNIYSINLIPWVVYILTFMLLCISVVFHAYRKKSHRKIREAMYESTDISIQKGIARYKKIEVKASEQIRQKFDDKTKQPQFSPAFSALITLIILIILFWLQRKVFQR